MKRTLIAGFALLLSALSHADWRMIVHLKPGSGFVDAQAMATTLGGTAYEAPGSPFALLALPSDPATYEAAQYALALGVFDVVWSGDDAKLHSAESVDNGTPPQAVGGGLIGVVCDLDVIAAANTTFLSQIDWDSSLAHSDGRTVRIAILDTGLSKAQNDLWGMVVASLDVFGGNADDKPTGTDSNGDGRIDAGAGHGTMVAGLVSAVAPKARLVIAKVADSDGQASAWGIIRGLAFAVAQGAEIANVSLGSETPVPAFSDAAAWARSKGLLTVAAIGNAGQSHAWYPSGDASVVSVTGLNPDDTKAAFSNYDAKALTAAPAVGLLSTWWDGGLCAWSGTSFASPFVAGALADCLRRTSGPVSPDILVAALAASGRSVDGVNDAAYKGKIGSVLDFIALDAQIRGH